MRYVLKDEMGVVHNVIEWDGQTEYSPPENLEMQEVSYEDMVGIGDIWDGEQFVTTSPSEMSVESLNEMKAGLEEQIAAAQQQLKQIDDLIATAESVDAQVLPG